MSIATIKLQIHHSFFDVLLPRRRIRTNPVHLLILNNSGEIFNYTNSWSSHPHNARKSQSEISMILGQVHFGYFRIQATQQILSQRGIQFFVYESYCVSSHLPRSTTKPHKVNPIDIEPILGQFLILFLFDYFNVYDIFYKQRIYQKTIEDISFFKLAFFFGPPNRTPELLDILKDFSMPSLISTKSTNLLKNQIIPNRNKSPILSSFRF